jgi:hypothetical protein
MTQMVSGLDGIRESMKLYPDNLLQQKQLQQPQVLPQVLHPVLPQQQVSQVMALLTRLVQLQMELLWQKKLH